MNCRTYSFAIYNSSPFIPNLSPYTEQTPPALISTHRLTFASKAPAITKILNLLLFTGSFPWGGDLGGWGGRSSNKFEVGDGPCIRPPNISMRVKVQTEFKKVS